MEPIDQDAITALTTYVNNHSDAFLLKLHLSAFVPLRILELQQQGGITDEDLAHVRSYQKDIAAHGDEILFRSPQPGQTATRINQLVDAIAVLAFCPGGITLFGMHFDASIPIFEQLDSTHE